LQRPGVNFINVLQAAFALTDPNSNKNTDNLTIFFALLGLARLKAACKMLMKLTTGVNFINILQAAFLYESVLRSFYLFTFRTCIFWPINIDK